MRLYVNIDHVATVREARRTDEPDPVRAAVLAELGGADGLTVHLREDRRHIQDRDVDVLMKTARVGINLEVAAASDVLAIACEIVPLQVTLVPEKREEITTEGGLDLSTPQAWELHSVAVKGLMAAGVRTSLFVDPVEADLKATADMGAQAAELHTGEYANTRGTERQEQLTRLAKAASLAKKFGLDVHAGHGLTYENVTPVAAIPEIEELNIGHSIMARAMFTGMEAAVRDMADILRRARAGS
jgi:pyridoxine 5-phosphate synthase